jgi:AbiV family abortive infection protein
VIIILLLGGNMYSVGSKECLRNAELLLEDAETLMGIMRLGTAQSLGVTSMEEVGKALVLELANLHYLGKDIVDIAMYKHAPKHVVLVGIEQSRILLGESLTQRANEFVMDMARFKSIQEEVKPEIQDVEKLRQNGLYVDVDSGDGRIKSSPANVQAENVQALLNRAEIFLALGKILCRTFREIKESGRPREDLKIQAVKLPEHMRSKEATLGAQPDYTITIVWDEI